MTAVTAVTAIRIEAWAERFALAHERKRQGKGRGTLGKLTQAQREDIARLFFENGYSQTDIVRMTGVSHRKVGEIVGSPGVCRGKQYTTWHLMITRCHKEGSPDYKYYGAKGVRVCDRWRNSFDQFKKDVGEPPTKEHTLDRIDVYGDYCPENTRWATRREQAQNRSYCTLSVLKAAAIRALAASNDPKFTNVQIASLIGCSETIVSAVVRGEAWTDG